MCVCKEVGGGEGGYRRKRRKGRGSKRRGSNKKDNNKKMMQGDEKTKWDSTGDVLSAAKLQQEWADGRVSL